MRARGGQHAFGAEEILDRERHAFHRTQLLAAGAPDVGGHRHGEGALLGLGDEGVEVAVLLHLREAGHGDIEGGELPLGETVERAGDGEMVELGHYSTTFGTTKKPWVASG